MLSDHHNARNTSRTPRPRPSPSRFERQQDVFTNKLSKGEQATLAAIGLSSARNALVAPIRLRGELAGVLLLSPGSNVNPFGHDATRDDTSIEDATGDLIEQIRAGDPHLQVVRGSTRHLDLRSGPALTAILRGVNPRTRLNERLTVVTHQLASDHLISMLFATPDVTREAMR